MRRYDYAVFAGDRYVHNAMLTRREAKAIEESGMRVVDVERAAKMGWTDLPRFRGRRYGWSRRSPDKWWR